MNKKITQSVSMSLFFQFIQLNAPINWKKKTKEVCEKEIAHLDFLQHPLNDF